MWGSTITRTMGRHQHADIVMPTTETEIMYYHRARGLLGLFEIMRVRGATLLTPGVQTVNANGKPCSYQEMVEELLAYYRNANNVPHDQSPHFRIVNNALMLLNQFTQLSIPMEFSYQREQPVRVKVLFLDDSSKFDKAAADIVNNRSLEYVTEIIYLYQYGNGYHTTSTPHITTTGFSYKQLGAFPTANMLQPQFRRAVGAEAESIRGAAKSFLKIWTTNIIAQCYGWRAGDIIISIIPQIAGGINKNVCQVHIVTPPPVN